MRASHLPFLGLALLFMSCADGPLGPRPPTLVDLAPLEAIPFEALGEGTLAFERTSSESAVSGVYVIDVEARTAYGFGGVVFNGPSLSPDATRFVFTRFSGLGAGYDVYSSDARGRDARRLSSIPGYDFGQVWFAGGSQIAYFSGETATHVVRQSPSLDPTDRALVRTYNRVCELVDNEAMSVSPAGVALYVREGCSETGFVRAVITLDLYSGDEARVLLDTTRTAGGGEGAVGRITSPVWSPDARHIAFKERVHVPETGAVIRTRIGVMNADGSDPVTILSLEGSGGGQWSGSNNDSVAWSPDGSKIAFNHTEGDFTDHIYVVGRDGEGLQRITSLAGASDRSLTWVP